MIRLNTTDAVYSTGSKPLVTGVQTCALPICFPVTIALPVGLEPVEYTASVVLRRIKELTEIEVSGGED